MNRRDFVRMIAAASFGLPLCGRGADSKLRAAVIGSTGHGDYGHGLEGIFRNRAGIEVVALADPEEAGRRRTAKQIGAAHQYTDYRELLEKELPQLVSIAMRQARFHYEIALAAQIGRDTSELQSPYE